MPFYGEQILKEIGLMQYQDIDDTVMVGLAKKILKDDAKPSYINRHLYTPVMAILRLALKEKAPQLARPKGYKDRDKTIAIPSPEWFPGTFPHMRPVTRALLLFLTIHGRRLGDALGRKPSDFNPDEGTLIVDRTKTGDPLMIDLHPQVVKAFLEMPDWQKHRWLFRDGPTSGSNVRKDIIVACLKANGYDHRIVEKKGGWKRAMRLLEIAPIPYYSPHEIGRHAFATRLLRAGYSLQYVKDAGGWKTLEVVSRIYGHLGVDFGGFPGWRCACRPDRHPERGSGCIAAYRRGSPHFPHSSRQFAACFSNARHIRRADEMTKKPYISIGYFD